MIYKQFKEKKLSLLGFGMMRLPVKEDKKTVDQEKVNEMVDLAYKGGVNYFDTAWIYMDGQSEAVTGKALSKYPRESYNLATKYPCGQIEKEDPEGIFEEQLKRCGVDYFDFYLFHSVNDKNIDTFLNPEIGIIDYFKKQKELGRIKHLGFSCHASIPNMKRFLEATKGLVEFCQLQTNYVDWTLQNCKEKYEIVESYGLPLWVMEPVRGSRIAKFNEETTNRLRALRPDESTPAWAFRFLQGLDNISMILSGMSNVEQIEDNLKTFEELKPLNEEEKEVIFDIAEFVKLEVPCTGCEYCVSHCPNNIYIPKLMKTFNRMRLTVEQSEIDYIDSLDDANKPSACIACGACAQVCPQAINIPDILAKVDNYYKEKKGQ